MRSRTRSCVKSRHYWAWWFLTQEGKGIAGWSGEEGEAIFAGLRCTSVLRCAWGLRFCGREECCPRRGVVSARVSGHVPCKKGAVWFVIMNGCFGFRRDCLGGWMANKQQLPGCTKKRQHTTTHARGGGGRDLRLPRGSGRQKRKGQCRCVICFAWSATHMANEKEMRQQQQQRADGAAAARPQRQPSSHPPQPPQPPPLLLPPP